MDTHIIVVALRSGVSWSAHFQLIITHRFKHHAGAAIAEPNILRL